MGRPCSICGKSFYNTGRTCKICITCKASRGAVRRARERINRALGRIFNKTQQEALESV